MFTVPQVSYSTGQTHIYPPAQQLPVGHNVFKLQPIGMSVSHRLVENSDEILGDQKKGNFDDFSLI